MSADTPMMQQYRRIKEQHPDAILFFRLGDFYEMFFHDAKEASAILGLTLTKRNTVPMCGVPYHAANTYIPRLLHAGKKIAVCEQTEEPKPGKGIVERKVTQVISPGTITEQDFLESHRDNYLVAACRIQDHLSLAWVDVSTGRFELHAYPWQQAQAGLQQEISRLSPRELIIQESLLDTEVGAILRNLRQVVINRYPDWFFSIEESYRSLVTYFSTVNLKGFGIEKDDPALASAGVLLEYVSDNAGTRLAHINSVIKVSDSEFVSLDEATQRNLELIENLQDGGSDYTLFNILNFTCTPMGARTLSRWILQPLRTVEAVRKRQDVASLLYHNQRLLTELREHLSNVRDLERLSSKVGMKRCNPREVEAIGTTLRVVGLLSQTVQNFEGDERVFPVSETIQLTASRIAEIAESGIAENPPVSSGDGGCIRDGYDAEVDRLRALHTSSDDVLREYVAHLQQETGISSLKVKYNRILGHFIEITKSNRTKVPDYFIPRQSLTQCDRFSTAELAKIEGELNDAQQNLIDREEQVFLEIRSHIEEQLATLQETARLLGRLDAHLSLAYAATRHGFVQPIIEDSRVLEIINGRHPVVENNLPPGEFVPNSTILNDASFALITGPNMAGKSTYLRQTALIVLMAQIGSFVPADEARIGIADCLFCRVGARDNLARGESTFLVEMSETAHILRTSTERSLIIMDEVGRGTSSTDGQAIAHAVCSYILNRIGARTLFATHYHQLSQIEHDNFQNLSLSVVEHGKDIIFMREIQSGPSNHSYGIQAARLAGVPDDIIHQAELLLKQIEPDTGAEVIECNHQSATASVQTVNHQLFPVESSIADRLRNIDPNSITPLDALNLLHELKSELCN